MRQLHFNAKVVTIYFVFILNLQLSLSFRPISCCFSTNETGYGFILHSATLEDTARQQHCEGGQGLSRSGCFLSPFSEEQEALVRGVQRDTNEDSSIAVNLQKCDGDTSRGLIYEDMEHSGEEEPIPSMASSGPWGHSIYSSLSYISNTILHRGQRSTLTRHSLGPTLPQVESVINPSAFGVKFRKCAQVILGTDPPQLAIYLLIHNLDQVGAGDLSQVAIRDSISGIIPLKSEGKVVETDFQTFALDSLPAGSQHFLNYTAKIRNPKSEVLYLPAFLSFSNASQNDVQMFGPLRTNLTLRVNNTDRIQPSHGLPLAGFVCGFLLALVMLSLGFLAMNLICARTRFSLIHKRKNRDESDPEYADWSMSETLKDEAAFEDKMVDIMGLEDPQNMYQALESLEMSSLLRATTHLESTRVQVYKDLTVSLLGGLGSLGEASSHTQQRLLNVLHGQLLGMEGRLKEEQLARMATLAGQCNQETREEMEAEHRREAAEKASAELLCQHADPQEVLRCSVLLEKLHKLTQGGLQRALLVRHEEASARVQRRLTEWRRVELHKIFCEELEEATRMGELEKGTAKSLQHDYFACQDRLEEVLDVVVANQRYMLAERHAQRRFLVHSLHSLKSLISDTFSSTSSNLGGWFNQIRRGSTLPAEQLAQLQDKAQQELLMVRQRLEDKLNQERRAMHSVLIKKRRELISDMWQIHNQRRRELSDMSKDGLVGRAEVAQHMLCWQNLLTAQSLELADLINSLDEEAAAEIRKVTMRVIQSSMAEVKAIQPSVVQALLNILPPGAPSASLLQRDPELGAGQEASALHQAQEKLHQEGQAAVRTLRCTREALQEAMERELREQKESRARSRAFFRCLCSCQLTLSEDDTLKMKLEFHKCLSVMDRCLVLPHAGLRAKLHAALAAWRKEAELQAENMHSESKPRTKGKAAQHKADPGAALLLHQRRLEERVQVFQKEKGMQGRVMDKVREETERERRSELRSQAGNLARQMAAIHYHKAEKRTRVLETSRAMLTLQSQLTRQLRGRRGLEQGEMAQSIHHHCSSLEEAEKLLQEERAGLGCLESAQPGDRPARIPEDSQGEEDEDDEVEEEEDESDRKRLFEVRRDFRMSIILQEALCKCDSVFATLTERLQEASARGQVMEDLKEQLELKRLYAQCDQELEFASRLVKQSQVSTEVLLEALRLLLPTLPESELLSVVDALCRPKHSLPSASMEQARPGSPREPDRSLLVKLREAMRCAEGTNLHLVGGRLQVKRQEIWEKLFNPPAQPRASKHLPPMLVEENRPEVAALDQSSVAENTPSQQPPLSTQAAGPQSEAPCSSPPPPINATHGPPSPTPSTGERLFVFRAPPESYDAVDFPRRKKKRNFLNLKKGSVAPTVQP
ncbi:limbin isoform X1 [Gadus morhua]|uniref:EvC ciliary complex subunit 2 n=2 Tax=Gadus morhua TaxID=8049 RepID=A0A8C5CYW5_GADMO|nr:limbin isoform X1 [Gadus morhua]